MTQTPTPMIARFAEVTPYVKHHAATVPEAAMESIAAHRVYPMMVPEDYEGRGIGAKIKYALGPIISIAECPPQQGAASHIHEEAVESFLIVSGKWQVFWGEHEEQSQILGPLDLVVFPKGIYRSFRNISDETARMIAIIQPAAQDQPRDSVSFSPAVGQRVERDFGTQTVKAFADIGIKFNRG